MKYMSEFRDHKLAARLVEQINSASRSSVKIMEVCGGQTHTILQYGIEDLLPAHIELLHGPGCPVCVTPVDLIDKAIAIAGHDDVIFCSFGDMLRVPGSTIDLLEAKARGADVRVVYSPLDALAIAQKMRDKTVVFFAVGFETTAPANAMSVFQAEKLNLSNFLILCSHVAVPPVMASILEAEDNQVKAFLGPGHVCAITGTSEYEELSRKYRVPIVISGFEPTDILEGILRCIRQIEQGQACLENQYARAVLSAGNVAAQAILTEVFEVADREWRGLGTVSGGGFKLSANFQRFDAELHFKTEIRRMQESSLCISGQILKGLKKPYQCGAFGTQCTPETPLGATMVSAEGTCANYYKFGKFSPGSEIIDQ